MPAYPANIDVSSLDGTTGFKFSPLTPIPSFVTGFIAVSSAGDVNGDGFTDLILGGQYDAGGYGAAYVVFGSTSGFGATFDLATLDGGNGFQLTGGAGSTGASVASAGDVNGDGFDDVIVGAPSLSAGASYVVFGNVTGFAANLDLASLDGSDGFKLSGGGARSGYSVASAGDIDGDGFDDLIVGVRGSAAAYVVFGKASGFDASIDLSGLDGSTGFKLSGGGTRTGNSVASAGDVNGDGFADLIVGAPFAAPSNIGAAYVVFGSASGFAANIDLSALDGSTGFQLRQDFVAGFAGYTGSSVSSGGDINGDGFDDVIVGAPGSGSGGNRGRTFVVFGKASGFGASVDLTTLDGTDGFALLQETTGDKLGLSVSAAGDVNDDGFADLIVGAPSSGRSYVVFGKASGFAASLALSSLDGSNGFRLSGVADGIGVSVASAGDVNGDGGDDFIVGGASGVSYVMYGTAPGDTAVTTLGTARLDILKGGQTDDYLLGMNGNDRMYGFAGNDTLAGGNGNDVLAGGAGDDVLSGGAGIDTADYAAEHAGVIANLATGKATGTSTGSDTLASVENLTGSSFNDVLTGDGGTNVLTGGAGDDTLEGGLGADAMSGGTGNDIYRVDNGDDVVTEAAGGGIDTVRTTLAAYALGTEVENLSFVGTGSFSGTGNALANALTGGAGDDALEGGADNDKLKGGAGADAMTGGTGNDTYYVDNFGDQVIEAALGGSDRVYATATWTMTASQEIESLRVSGLLGLTLTGNEFANAITGGIGGDTLNGGAGNDTLDGGDGDDALNGDADDDKLKGGAGADAMTGGTGNDTYYVDNLGDQVIEAALGGSDRVYATATWTMTASQEIESLRVSGSLGLTLTGNEFANAITGGIGGDTLNGGAGNDTLDGGDGDDTLNGGEDNDRLVGGLGADVMSGDVGDDRYYVDDAGDQVIEAAGDSADEVYASIDYALTDLQDIETLRADGSAGRTLDGNSFDNKILGGSGSDTLSGGAGNDRLNGGAGIDVMTGGTGNDAYYIDNVDDQVIEDALGGSDTVYATVSWSMAMHQEIETLRVSGTDGLSLAGNELGNTLLGGVGNDTLAGGAGNDLLTGGTGSDVFLFDTDLGPANVDTVADFGPAGDSFVLAQAIFGGLSMGLLSASAFSLNSATGSDAQIVYDETTGALFYDANGSADGGSTRFATATLAPTLDNTYFTVV